MRHLLALVFAVLLTTPVMAADLTVTVTDAKGAPLENAVVMVKPAGGAKGPIRFGWPYVMSQRDMQFDPFVLIVPVGARVAFPNRDPFRHHVYSFAGANTFELKLYGHEETRHVTFPAAGVVAVGCNIHDNMTAFIRVVDTPFALKTDARGQAVLRGLPSGAASVIVWHPYLKTRRDIVRPVTVASDSSALKVAADVRRPALKRGGY